MQKKKKAIKTEFFLKSPKRLQNVGNLFSWMLSGYLMLEGEKKEAPSKIFDASFENGKSS